LTNATFNNGQQIWTLVYHPTNVQLDAGAVNPITATWNTASGNWTTNSGSPNFTTPWTCSMAVVNGCVPNNGHDGLGNVIAGANYDVVLNSVGNTMTLNSSSSPTNITVNSLTDTKGALTLTGTGSLTVTGNVAINDTLTVFPTARVLVQGNLSNFSAGTLTG